ncbi:neprilysin, partial [Biomphalaria pfeifferi]
LDGASSLKENMCDLEGLKLSYKAFQSSAKSQRTDERKLPGINMNHNQIFFLSFAQ